MRKDAEQNSVQILAAAEAMHQQGKLIDANMRDIASAAGVGVGTLYRHFAGKGDLYMALVYAHLNVFLDESDRIIDGNQVHSDVDLPHFLKRYMGFREDNEALLLSAEGGLHQGRSFYRSEEFSRLHSLISRLMQQRLPQSTEDELAFKTDMLIAMLKSDIYDYERTVRQRTQNELVQQLIDFVTD